MLGEGAVIERQEKRVDALMAKVDRLENRRDDLTTQRLELKKQRREVEDEKTRAGIEEDLLGIEDVLANTKESLVYAEKKLAKEDKHLDELRQDARDKRKAKAGREERGSNVLTRALQDHTAALGPPTDQTTFGTPVHVEDIFTAADLTRPAEDVPQFDFTQLKTAVEKDVQDALGPFFEATDTEDTHATSGSAKNGFVCAAQVDGKNINNNALVDGTSRTGPHYLEIKDGEESQANAVLAQGINRITGALALCAFVLEANSVACTGSRAYLARSSREDVGMPAKLAVWSFPVADVAALWRALQLVGMKRALRTPKSKQLYKELVQRDLHPGLTRTDAVHRPHNNGVVVAKVSLPEFSRSRIEDKQRTLVFKSPELYLKLTTAQEGKAVAALWGVLPHYVVLAEDAGVVKQRGETLAKRLPKVVADGSRSGWWHLDRAREIVAQLSDEEGVDTPSALWMECGEKLRTDTALSDVIQHLHEIWGIGWVHGDARTDNARYFPLQNRHLLFDLEFSVPRGVDGNFPVARLESARETCAPPMLREVLEHGQAWQSGFDALMFAQSMALST